MTTFKNPIRTKSPEETRAFAERFAKSLKPGDIVALTGKLGAGKTCFAQGLGWGLGVDRKVYLSSPTFTLVKEYSGVLKIFHMDLYRLSGPGEFFDSGCGDYLAGEGVTIIEWPEKIEGELPDEKTIRVKLEAVSPDERKITIYAGD